MWEGAGEEDRFGQGGEEEDNKPQGWILSKTKKDQK